LFVSFLRKDPIVTAFDGPGLTPKPPSGSPLFQIEFVPLLILCFFLLDSSLLFKIFSSSPCQTAKQSHAAAATPVPHRSPTAKHARPVQPPLLSVEFRQSRQLPAPCLVVFISNQVHWLLPLRPCRLAVSRLPDPYLRFSWFVLFYLPLVVCSPSLIFVFSSSAFSF
jgi:hypothetical protein